ncbi:MAG: site-specific integrase, partial [bacterium]|nr:site-specific integrase [bacterium]
FLENALKGDRYVRTFCTTLYYTGCRISEALELTPRRIDLSGNLVIFESLKKRRRGVFRAVPVPSDYIDTMNMVHAIRDAQDGQKKAVLDHPLWDWSRTTAWRRVKDVMDSSGIQPGPHLCPKGLRHGYGIHAITEKVPLNMLQKWMGHSDLKTTSIYANAVGEEQNKIASRMWS